MALRRRALRPALLLLVVALGAATACQPVGPAPSPPPSRDSSGAAAGTRGWFQPGTTWWGDFGDPHVVRVGSTYYAYASPVGGRYLPVLTSTDLVTWKVHGRWTTSGPPGTKGYSVTEDTAIPAEIRARPTPAPGSTSTATGAATT